MRSPAQGGPAIGGRSAALRAAGALVVLLLGLSASIATGRWVQLEMLALEQARRDASAARAAAHVEKRLAAYREVLLGLRALFHAGEVSRDSFRRYTQALALERRLPGFQVLNYAPHVPAASKAAFEAETGLSITPAGMRDGYHPIALIEPIERNERFLGKDIAAAPHARTALEVARDTDDFTSSGRLIAPRGPQQGLALAIRLPVYRPGMPTATLSERGAAYLGSVGAGFLVAESFADLAGVVPGLRVRLFDGGPVPIVEQAGDVPETRPEKLLFDTAYPGGHPPAGAAAETPGADRVRSVRTVKLADRVWEVEVSAPAGEAWSPLPLVVGAVGVLATMLACMLLVGSVRRPRPD